VTAQSADTLVAERNRWYAEAYNWRMRALFYEAELERVWEQLVIAFDERDDARRERNILERERQSDGTVP
jgi:hypothetical protein